MKKMKKQLTFLLTAALIAMFFIGCGSSTTAVSNDAVQEAEKTEDAASSGTEAGKTENGTAAGTEAGRTEASQAAGIEIGQDETAAAAGTESGQDETAAAAGTEETDTETVSAQDEKKPAAEAGFRLLGQIHTSPGGKLQYKAAYYEDNSLASVITAMAGPYSEYVVEIFDREYDEKGRWISSSEYNAYKVTGVERINLDDYKTEENKVSTEVCKYNENGFIVEHSNLDGSLIDVRTYNKQGKPVHEDDYADGFVAVKKDYIYDDQGNLVKIVSDSESYDWLEEYTPFGVTSILTLRQKKSDEGETTENMELHYDDKGLLTSGEWFENGDLESTYSYELDEYGNIIRFSIFNKDGTLRKNVENEIVPLNE